MMKNIIENNSSGKTGRAQERYHRNSRPSKELGDANVPRVIAVPPPPSRTALRGDRVHIIREYSEKKNTYANVAKSFP